MLIDTHQLVITLSTLLVEEKGLEEVLLDRMSGAQVNVIPLELILLL